MYEFYNHGSRGAYGGECEARTIAVSLDCDNTEVIWSKQFREAGTIFSVTKADDVNGMHQFYVQNMGRQ